MVKSSGIAIAFVALAGLSYGCAQILDLDNDYEHSFSGAGGAGGQSSASTEKGSVTSTVATVGSAGVGGGAASSVGAGGGSVVSSSSVATVGAGGNMGAGGGPTSFTWMALEPVVSPGKECAKIYSYTLPSWLEFTSDTPNERTSQIDVDAICRGFSMGMARARNAGTGWGLNIESTRTNLVQNSDSWGVPALSGWGAGTMTTADLQPDPAGGAAATLFLSPSNATGNYSNYSTPLVVSQVGSTWARGVAGPPPYAHFRHDIAGSWVDVDTMGWKRYSVAQMSSTTAEVALETRDVPAGAGVLSEQRQFVAFGAQIEDNASYPSSYIPTAGAPLQRQSERLASVKGLLDNIAPGGYFTVALQFAPNFALGSSFNEMSADEYNLLYFENKNRLFLRKSDRRIVLRINSIDAVSNPLEFKREHELTIIATSRMGMGISLAISGASVGDSMVANGPEAPLNTGPLKQVTILGDEGGAEECGDLRSIAFGINVP